MICYWFWDFCPSVNSLHWHVKKFKDTSEQGFINDPCHRVYQIARISKLLIDREASTDLLVDISSEFKWEEYRFAFDLHAVCCLSASSNFWLCFMFGDLYFLQLTRPAKFICCNCSWLVWLQHSLFTMLLCSKM